MDYSRAMLRKRYEDVCLLLEAAVTSLRDVGHLKPVFTPRRSQSSLCRVLPVWLNDLTGLAVENDCLDCNRVIVTWVTQPGF